MLIKCTKSLPGFIYYASRPYTVGPDGMLNPEPTEEDAARFLGCTGFEAGQEDFLEQVLGLHHFKRMKLAKMLDEGYANSYDGDSKTQKADACLAHFAAADFAYFVSVVEGAREVDSSE